MRILSVSTPEINACDICSAEYELEFKNIKTKKESIENYINQTDIPIMKKTKKGEKKVNLKDYIKKAEIKEVNDNNVKMTIVLSAGGTENIKPMLFTESLIESLKLKEEAETYIHRTKIFYKKVKGGFFR